MNCFLEPFVEVMNELSSVGVPWTDASGTQKVSRVFPGPCTVDTVARCMLMNMTQFNGAFGCGWCEAEGEVVEKGRGHVRVYPAVVGTTRSHESFLHHSEKAEKQGAPSHGVKGASILFGLAFFNFASGFVVDYMHAVCSGFVRSTAFMWFKGRSGQHYHLGSFMSEIDMKLKALQPIWEISRLPRSLKDMKFWKSSEWRSWMLFYSPVVLKGFLPKKYFDNWLKFVRIMHFLLSRSVPLDSLPQVKRAMTAFLKEFEELYGQVNMTYNTHLLLHLIDSVRLWGPLWGYSAYPFESMNGKLVRLVNGTRYVQCQIIDKFSIIRSLPKLWAVASNRSADDQIAVLLRSLMKGYNLRKHVVKNGAVIFQGKGQPEGDKVLFKKVRIGAFTYCVKALDKSRRKNSYVFVGGIFGQLVAIVAWCKRGHTSCSCVKNVTLRLEQLKVKDFVLSSFGALSLVQFVEVQHTNAIIEKDAASVQKCIVLCNSSRTCLCVVNDTYVLESV
ncbi:uncharacterized protein LOC121838324 [Ixodes scapularis]|uniref:uncharacterized protein LOC121838324 n=2 Tax=Ixodes scapularis TaxID=6945 RepID=UPI001C38D5CA|nr:uncharacterized protein LOC121838324 [Ixodes scapularis]